MPWKQMLARQRCLADSQSTPGTPLVSFLLRGDIAKLDRLDAETRFLGKHRIGTIGELTAHRETASAEIDALTAQRQELRKELRRLNRQGDPKAVDEVKQKISALSSRIRAARKEVVLSL